MTALKQIIMLSLCLASIHAYALPRPSINNFDNYFKEYGSTSPTATHRIYGETYGAPYEWIQYNGYLLWSYTDGQGEINMGGLNAQSTLTITNRILGRITYTPKTKTSLTNEITTILGADSPSISSITGDNPGASGKHTHLSSEALYFRNIYPNNTTLGSYRLVEGNYFGGQNGPGHEGGDFKLIHRLEIEGSEFRGGDAGGRGYTTYGMKDTTYQKHGGNGLAVEHATEGVFINNYIHTSNPLTNFNNSGNRAFNDAFVGGSGADLITTNDVSNTHITIAGGAGALIHGTDRLSPIRPSGPVNITGGLFIGGGNGTNTTRLAHIKNNTATHVTLDTRGGIGLHIENAESSSLTGSHIQGGDAGKAFIDSAQSKTYTYGGHGLYASFSGRDKFRLTEATCLAGQAANAELLGEKSEAHAFGGSGAVLIDHNSVELDHVTAIGSPGAIAFAPGSNSTAIAHGGHGLYLENSTLRIDSGTYQGADGGAATGSVAQADGGSGLFATNATLYIRGGTYVGGRKGNATGAVDGASITAIDSKLTITSGNLPQGLHLKGDNTVYLSTNTMFGAGLINEGQTILTLDSFLTETTPVPSYTLLDGSLSATHSLLPSLVISNGFIRLQNYLAITNSLDVHLLKLPQITPILVKGPTLLDGELNLSIAPEAMTEAHTIPLLLCDHLNGTFSNHELQINYCTYQINYTTNLVYLEKVSEQQTALGTPYWWLAKHGIPEEAFNGADLIDHDLDGMITRYEYIAGTDPMDPASLLTTHITPAPEGLTVLSWPSAPGRIYTIQYTTNLTQNFAPFISNLPATPPQNHFTIFKNPGHPAFFRVSVELP